ncbi:MAG: PD-(D/E)XK nuclease family protein [Deltaproteobacteria bacterium]|jgi:ATP-dependent helicase/DNAse subunit B|nr:PD-(D/E)XK nuclease family protein [Deltaproteobacteria bacterium]
MTTEKQPNWKELFSSSNFSGDLLFIVPTETVRNLVAQEILADKEVILGPRVMTFNLLEKQLSDEMGPSTIGFLLRLMALNAVAADYWEPLNLPGTPTPSRTIEVARQLGDGLDRLRLAGISWDTLESFEPKEVTGILAKNCRRYDAWLGNRDDEFTRRYKLLEALKDGRKFKALEGVDTIHCRHSKRLSPFEAELIKALAVHRKVELKMSAPKWLLEEKIPPGTSYHRLRFIRDLERSGSPGLNLSWLDLEDSLNRKIPPALKYASENLFGPVPTQSAPDPTGVLSIMAVPTKYHEVEEVGRKLKALLVKGVPSYRVALAVPNVSLWLPSILDVARRFGLPLHYPRGAPLSSYPPVTALLDLIGLWGSNWEVTRILKVLESPYFDFELEGDLRPYIYEIGISDDRASGGFKVNYDKIVDPVLKERLKPAYLAISRLKHAEMNLLAAKTWKSFRDRLQSILTGFRWPGDPITEPPTKDGEYHFWVRTSTDFRAVQSMADHVGVLFDTLVTSQHTPAVSLDSFKLWLNAYLAHVSFEIHGGHNMGIKVLNYLDLHGAFFEALFLMGLNDKVFPAARPEPCWWPETLVEGLAKTALGRRLWYTASENYHKEEDIVAQALAQANQVTISYQTSTEDIRPALPSPVVESLIDLFPEGVLKVERPGWPLPPPAERVCDPGELWLNLVVNHPTKKAPELFTQVSRRPHDDSEGLWASIWARRKSLGLVQEKLRPEQLQAWMASLDQYEDRPSFSVRHLTTFSDCPRSFWYKEILKLSFWPGPLEHWTSADQGEVLHQTLERFLNPTVRRETKDYGPSRLRYIFWEVIHRHYCYKPVGRKPIFDALSLKLEAALMAWIERHKDLAKAEIAAIEWSFGARQGNQAAPFKIDSPSGSFYLTGRVDRVDRESGHVVVRDYKTNRSAYYDAGGKKPAEGRRPTWHYPMILYALAAKENFRAEAEAVIEFVDPREGQDQLWVEPGEPAEFSELWEALLSGDLTTQPNSKNCDSCAYFRLCRPHSRIGLGRGDADESPAE